MHTQSERIIEVNKMLVMARWFYVGLAFLLLVLLNAWLKPETLTISFGLVIIVVIFLFSANILFYLILRGSAEKEEKDLFFLSFLQIIAELSAFSFLMLGTGGAVSIAVAFFFLPIVSASLLFGFRGAIIVAVVSALAINAMVVLNYFLLFGNIDISDSAALFGNELVKTFTASVSYLAVGVFSGYASFLLTKHEKLLAINNDKLKDESGARVKELEKLNKAAGLLASREIELTGANRELDKKIDEIKKSKESLLRAYKDVQKAGEEIEEERNKTMAVISNFISPIIVLDKNDKIILFNPPARKMLGVKFLDYGRKISSDGKYGLKNFSDIIRVNNTFKELDEPNEEGVILKEEITINDNDQELFYKVVTVDIMVRGNEKLGIMKLFYDLTREKELDRLKSEFISVAAHQLRTPLASIKWIFEMVLSGDTGDINGEQRKFLTKGHESNERMIDLVNDLLNVSRIEEGRFGYVFEKIDLSLIVEEVVDSLDGVLAKKGIKLNIIKPEKLPAINADRERLTMVMQNILENAVKYTPEHGKIELAIVADEKNLNVSVSDNGVGIPLKDQQKLFSKFFRATNVVRLQTKGSGLGLFIAKNIIEKHGGQINVESEEGKGTKVIFALPIN